MRPEDRAALIAALRQAAEGAAVGPAEVRPTGRSDARLLICASRDNPRGVNGAIVYLIDTSAQKRFEEQYAQSQKLETVGQIAGGIAHDFNNLLTAMLGFCDLLLLRHEPGDQSFADIMQIKQNANRAANLVRQLLAFSRQQTLQPKVLNLTGVLAELAHLLRRLIGENIELTIVHDRDLGLIKADQTQLEQVIINLAATARDAMAAGGRLTLRTSNVDFAEPTRFGGETIPPGGYVLMEVTGTGVGIAEEHLAKIFEPLFSTKALGAGTGLGLSTVYGIVKQTGGFIVAASEEGRGATFRIYLLRHAPEAVAAAPAAAESGPERRDLTGKGSVLLVEDKAPVRVFAARALTNKGYTVVEADSGEATLAHLERGGPPFDLLISDVVMPGMDDPTLLRAARALQPGVKAVLISGYAEEVFRRSLGREEGVVFLGKPFSLKDLAATVKAVIAGERPT